MHLPHLSPTGLAGRASSVDSMDDDSSGSVMGYGNPYLASGMSKEIGNSLTQDPDAAYRYVGKLNAQKHDSSSWKMDKLCDGRSNDSTSLGHWLDGEEEVRETDLDASEEEEKQSTEEEKYNADDEDRFSTEEEAKYSEEFDSSTEGTGKDSGDEEGATREDTFPTKANYLAPSWLKSKTPTRSDLTPRRKLLWDGGEDRGLGSGEGWPSNSSREPEPSLTESEESGVELRTKQGDAPSGSPRACPVLCFDEYGNLITSYQEPSVAEKSEPAAALPIPEVKSGVMQEPSQDMESPTSNPSPKALRSRTRVSQESSESFTPSLLSEQELRQAFKEEYNTGATSRYGRARKRKTVDGFFFGTINFNELRKITSGSPKKASKGGGSKNNSPDQKVKSKEEARSSFPAGPEVKNLKDLNQNGIEILDSHPINGEVESPAPPLETVQMDQAKESSFTVQKKELQAKEKPAARRRNTAAAASASATRTTAIVEKEGAKPEPAQEGIASSKIATTAKSVDSSGSTVAGTNQQPLVSRRVRSQRQQRVRSQVVTLPRPFRSSRLAAAQASQAPPPPPLNQLEANHHIRDDIKEEPLEEQSVTIKEEPLEEESVTIKEEPVVDESGSFKSEPLEEDSQLTISDYPVDTHSDGHDKMGGLTRRSASRRTSDAKALEEVRAHYCCDADNHEREREKLYNKVRSKFCNIISAAGYR